MDEDFYKEIKRLNFENLIWGLFIFLCILNIYGDDIEKVYLFSKDNKLKSKSDNLFVYVILGTIFIYTYFFVRNYRKYKEVPVEKKGLYMVKLLSSVLFLVGAFLLLYFQKNQQNFIGSPNL